MGTHTSHFLGKPATSLGWWSVGFGGAFTALFVLVSNDIIHFSGRLTIALGVVAGILTLITMIWKRERSWLLWLVLLPGLFGILFAAGEILSPH